LSNFLDERIGILNFSTFVYLETSMLQFKLNIWSSSWRKQ